MKNALYILLCLYLIGFVYRENWNREIVGGGDAWGYYVYLPATFIHGDLDSLTTSYKTRMRYNKGYWIADNNIVTEAYTAPNGNRVVKYTVGMAMMELPFFAVAHVAAGVLGYPQDGCSLPYVLLVNLGLLFYTLGGLYYLRKWLRLHYDDTVVGWLLLLVGAGTNLYFFALTGMAHAIICGWYAVLLYNTELFYQKKAYIHAIGIGIAMGFIVLIRPVELVAVFIPLLYGLGSAQAWRERIKLPFTHYKQILLAVLSCFLVGMWQFLYWKKVTGHWVFYSYGEESFDFKNPHLYEGLFGFQNGWFVYTPAMGLLLLGLFWFKDKLMRGSYWFIIPLLATHIYITYSWWCWQYINGLGSRPMVDIYPVALIPIAALLGWLYQRARYGLPLLVLPFVALNLFQTWQQWEGLIFAECSNAQFYKQSFLKTKLNYSDLVVFDIGEAQPEPSRLGQPQTLVFYQLDSLQRVEKGQFSPSAQVADSLFAKIQPQTWLKISCRAKKNYKGSDIYRMASLVIELRERGAEKPLVWKGLRVDNKIALDDYYGFWGGKPYTWGEVSFYLQTRQELRANMELKAYVWNNSPFPVDIEWVKIEAQNPLAQ